MMTTELTGAMYEELMNVELDYGCDNLDCTFIDDSPVFLYLSWYQATTISWYESAELANLLSDFEGLGRCYDDGPNYELLGEYVGANIYNCPGYRLPTEAEWEYAARSGTEYEIWTEYGGSDIEGLGLGESIGYNYDCESGLQDNNGGSISLLDYAWFCGNNSSYQVKRVASLLPNGFGLYDMHGNVAEWVQDWSSDSINIYQGLSSIDSTNFPYSLVDPYSAPSGTQKILRGGSFNSWAYQLTNDIRGVRVADESAGIRVGGSWTYRTFYQYLHGVRLVRTAN